MNQDLIDKSKRSGRIPSQQRPSMHTERVAVNNREDPYHTTIQKDRANKSTRPLNGVMIDTTKNSGRQTSQHRPSKRTERTI